MNRPTRKYRGASAAERRSARREQLVAAGVEVFGERGFHAATVREICQRASLTERYFYESFAGQAELFAAAYDSKLDELQALILESLKASPPGLRERATAGLTVFFETMQNDQPMARILLMEIYGAQYDLQRLYERSIRRFSQMIQSVALPLDQASARPGYDPGLLATGLVGVCIQMAGRWAIEGYRQPPSHLVANCMLIFEGLAARLGIADSGNSVV